MIEQKIEVDCNTKLRSMRGTTFFRMLDFVLKIHQEVSGIMTNHDMTKLLSLDVLQGKTYI